MSAEAIEIEPTDVPVTVRRVRSQRRTKLEAKLALPPRPKTTTLIEAPWMAEAACAADGIPDVDRDAFTTVDDQADAWPLVERHCDSCPVARHCLEDGRNVHGSGIYGGIVLDDGHLAADARGDLTFRSTAAWIPPRRLEEILDELAEQADEGVSTSAAARAIFGTKDPTTSELAATKGLLSGRLQPVQTDSRPPRWFAPEPTHHADEEQPDDDLEDVELGGDAPADDEPRRRCGQRWQPKRRNKRRR